MAMRSGGPTAISAKMRTRRPCSFEPASPCLRANHKRDSGRMIRADKAKSRMTSKSSKARMVPPATANGGSPK